MIKTHNQTKLKYLCITKKDDWVKYKGSGGYWINHLRKYGDDISTELLYETEDYDDFLIQCLLYSELYNVALSEEFANQIPESGYDSNVHGYNNLELWWQYASDDMKRDVYNRRKDSLKLNHWIHNDDISNQIKSKISEKQLTHWSQFSLDERRLMTADIRAKATKFFEDRSSQRYIDYTKKQSENTRRYLANTPFEVLSERNRKHRLNMTTEGKRARAEKIREVYKTGKHDAIFKKMSQERVGLGNPGAKVIVWYGEKYTMGQFYNFVKETGLIKADVDKILDDVNIEECYRDYPANRTDYEVLICPHCNKNSGGRIPSGFKRWHFNNCKTKKEKNESKKIG